MIKPTMIKNLKLASDHAHYLWAFLTPAVLLNTTRKVTFEGFCLHARLWVLASGSQVWQRCLWVLGSLVS